MNTPSPLVPQGTSPDRGRSSLYFKILMIVSLHVVLIGGMLLQGCSDTHHQSGTGSTSGSDTNSQDLTTLPPVNTNPPPAIAPGPSTSAYTATPVPPYTAPGTNPTQNPIPSSTIPSPVTTPVAPVTAPAAEGAEYVVTRGDTLAVIAKKNGVTLKALEEANPGLNPRKLRVGAKLQVPAGGTASAAGVASAGGTSGLGASDTGDTTTYVVKSGDMLGRIAKSHGTTVAKIKALNDLKTSSIKVGQKLKLPGASTASLAPPVTPMPAPAPTAPATYTPPSYATTSQPAAGTH